MSDDPFDDIDVGMLFSGMDSMFNDDDDDESTKRSQLDPDLLGECLLDGYTPFERKSEPDVPRAVDGIAARKHKVKRNNGRKHSESSDIEVISISGSSGGGGRNRLHGHSSMPEYVTGPTSKEDHPLPSDGSRVTSSPYMSISHMQRVIDTQHETDDLCSVTGLLETETHLYNSDIESEPAVMSEIPNYIPVEVRLDNRNTNVIGGTKNQYVPITSNSTDGVAMSEGLSGNLINTLLLNRANRTRIVLSDGDKELLDNIVNSKDDMNSSNGSRSGVHLVLSLDYTNSQADLSKNFHSGGGGGGGNNCRDIEMKCLKIDQRDDHVNIGNVKGDNNSNIVASCNTGRNGVNDPYGGKGSVVLNNEVDAMDDSRKRELKNKDENINVVYDGHAEITQGAGEIQEDNMEYHSVAGGGGDSCSVSSNISKTVSKQCQEFKSISSDSCRSLKSRTSSISFDHSSLSEPAASHRGRTSGQSKSCSCDCNGYGDNSVMGEAISFFALKHVLALVKEIGECLSSVEDAQVRWQDIVSMQSRAQRFVDEAVRVNFKNDDLTQYQMSLPKSLAEFTSSAPLGAAQAPPHGIRKQPAVVNRNVPIATTPGDTSSDRDAYNPDVSTDYRPPRSVEERQSDVKMETSVMMRGAASNRRTRLVTSMTADRIDEDDNDDDDVKVEDRPFPKIRTFEELRRCTDSDDSVVMIGSSKRVRNGKDTETQSKQDDDDDLFGSDYSMQDDAGDISNLCDPLAEARKVYMARINSNEIHGMDLRIPGDVMATHGRLFCENFEFSRKVNEINTRVFGYSGFRGVQLAAINSVLLGKDCFVMMATGGGKSHCFQLPSKLLGGVVVVFSPLISLMEDQRRVMEQYGIVAETVNASTSSAEIRALSKRYLDQKEIFKNGSILFITPEKFDKSATVLRLLDDIHSSARLKLFVIDEAHCVSQWGLSFRKDYRKLCNLKSKFPDVPILAMTATATQEVAADIIEVLRIPTCVRLRTTINRPNLWIECREKTKDYLKEMIEILRTTTGCGIVYTLTVSDCEKVARELENASISVGAYHAKLDASSRKEVQRRWTKGEIRVMTATIAFGMGIDKSDVRFVFHTSAPVSILGYYQEIGRAGRDGKYSTTILWYNLRDFERHKNLGQRIATTRHTVTGEEISDYPTLANMREYCQNRSVCRRLLLFRAFGEDPEGEFPANCRGCDNCCLNMMSERVDATEDALIVCKFVEETSRYYHKGILTMNILCDALRGSNRSTIVRYGLCNSHYHGAMKQQKPKYIFQIIQELVNLRVLRECRRKRKSFEHTVMMLGLNAKKLKAGMMRVNITCYKPLIPSQGEVPESNSVAAGEGEMQIVDVTTATVVEPEPEPEPPKSKRRKQKVHDKTQPAAEVIEVSDTVPPIRGIGASQLVEALKGANALRRRDSQRSDSSNGDLKTASRGLFTTSDTSRSTSRQSYHKELGGTKPAFTTVCPEKVLIGTYNGQRSSNHNNVSGSPLSAVGKDTDSKGSSGGGDYDGDDDHRMVGGVPGRGSTHAGTNMGQKTTHADSNLQGTVTTNTVQTGAASAWRSGLSRAIMLMTNGKTTSNVDVQIARHNNIRRKVPLDLLGPFT